VRAFEVPNLVVPALSRDPWPPPLDFKKGLYVAFLTASARRMDSGVRRDDVVERATLLKATA
jgi:hypothetical protein